MVNPDDLQENRYYPFIFSDFKLPSKPPTKMGNPKGQHLYVNLGSSQTKRRLKGFGHGVRQIQSAGRNRAVIVHTATGRHLEELQARFADVGCASTESGLDEPLEGIRNLGPKSKAWLRAIGIRSREDLRRCGAVAAFRIVSQRFPTTNLNLLWAMAAGLENRDWQDLRDSEKDALRNELESA